VARDNGDDLDAAARQVLSTPAPAKKHDDPRQSILEHQLRVKRGGYDTMENQSQYVDMPSLEAERQVAQNRREIARAFDNPSQTYRRWKEDEERAPTQSSAAHAPRQASASSSLASSFPPVSGSAYHTDRAIAGDGVMRVVIEQLDEQTRRAVDLTRSTRELFTKDLRRAEAKVISDMPHFDGTPSKAPGYYVLLCQRMSMYPFQLDECLRIMLYTMKRGPAAWFGSVLNSVGALYGQTDEQKMAFVLGRFKQQYLNANRGMVYRSEIRALELRGRVDEKALAMHHHRFTELYQAAHVCGTPISLMEQKEAYLDAMTDAIRTYIGNDHEDMQMIDDLYQAATKAASHLNKRTHPVSRDRDDVVELSNINVSEINAQLNALGLRSLTREEIMQKGLKCFWCGSPHHMMHQCDIMKTGGRTTPLGMEAWSKIAKLAGWDEDSYDEWVKKRKEKIMNDRSLLRSSDSADRSDRRDRDRSRDRRPRRDDRRRDRGDKSKPHARFAKSSSSSSSSSSAAASSSSAARPRPSSSGSKKADVVEVDHVGVEDDEQTGGGNTSADDDETDHHAYDDRSSEDGDASERTNASDSDDDSDN
jgi:hypothetical protein